MFCISACLAAKISIHALRVEGDDAYHTATRCCRNFYPRPPGGGRPVSAGTEGIAPAISIHALRVEGDRRRFSGSIKDNPFLSTPSGWRATGDHAVLQRGSVDFYPRPPGGGRPAIVRSPIPDFPISIHALRVEGDSKYRWKPADRAKFLSTPSGWRATRFYSRHFHRQLDFYPRPPGGGRPHESKKKVPRTADFYPRPPGGGRQQKRTKFSSVFAQKGEEFASLRRGKRKFAGGVLKRTNFGF